jgi:hypothetical protein
MKKTPERTLLRLLHHRWNKRTLSAVSWVCERFLLPGCFSRVEYSGLERVAAKARAGKRLIFIPDHQSEYDWLLLQDKLFRTGLRTAIQAGDNLFVGPLDPILRGCGAFMSVRQEKSFYSTHWIYDLLARALGQRPIRVTREQYSRLYPKQLARILGREGYNLLVFPGYETDPFTGLVKYGRSYSGLFNPLSPYVFITVSKVLKGLGLADAEYIPVAVTYERVPEDILFREFKASTRRTKIAKYIYDHYYTFFKAPFSKELRQEKSRVCVKFGEGVPAAFGGKARDFAERMRHEIGRLIRVYETTLIFHSLNDKFAVSKQELRRNLHENLRVLRAKKIDCSPLYDAHGRLQPLDRMLNRVARLFNFTESPVIPLKTYRTLEHDRNEVFIHNPHLASYYSNKLRYILEAD